MTSTSEADIPQQLQRLQDQRPQQGGNAAAAVAAPPSSGALSFDDVSKLFSLPIAEAASILGVCTSVLKRICRNNGIIRWPYRKFLAGKTVEDIRKDAAREKSIKLAELSKIAKQKIDGSNIMPSTSVGLSSTFGNKVVSRAHETSKFQRGDSAGGHVSQHPQDSTFLQYKWTNMVQSNQTKNIPTYMDEFRYGFPAKGLSTTSIKWWGSSSSSSNGGGGGESTAEGEAKRLSNETSEQPSAAAATLCSLRKEAVQCGVRVGISKGCGPHFKLGNKQKSVLLQVFKSSSLPDQWKDILS